MLCGYRWMGDPKRADEVNAMDWDKLSTHAKIADLVRNTAGVIVGICLQMEKNRSESPVEYMNLIKHRLESLLEGLEIINKKINEKTNAPE